MLHREIQWPPSIEGSNPCPPDTGRTSRAAPRAASRHLERSDVGLPRQSYLKEFERRNPTGFATWLTTGFQIPGNLIPYRSEGGVGQVTIDYDELTRGQI